MESELNKGSTFTFSLKVKDFKLTKDPSFSARRDDGGLCSAPRVLSAAINSGKSSSGGADRDFIFSGQKIKERAENSSKRNASSQSRAHEPSRKGARENRRKKSTNLLSDGK